jgi:hypothetical protein
MLVKGEIMLLNFHDLNEATRQHMLEEIREDIDNGNLYISSRLSGVGQQDYPNLLQRAAEQFDDEWLASEIAQNQRLNVTLQRHTKRGITQARMPSNAHETLAMGEFNSFYIRAICLRAINEGRTIEVYRARPSQFARPESEAAIRTRPNPVDLLAALRVPVEKRAAPVIPEPNSGISVRLV